MKTTTLFIFILFVLSCQSKKEIENTSLNYKETMLKTRPDVVPPIAKKIATKLEKHGDTRIDNYYWMKLTDDQKNAKNPDDQTKDVLAYLNAENAYLDQMTAHESKFKDSLYNEIIGRIKQTDMSVPYKDNGYYYITRFEEGKEYAIRSRKKETLDAPEEIMLDENELAKPHKYFATAGRDVSPDNKILAYGEDVVSRRQYKIKFKNLENNQYLKDEIENTTGDVVWANDNKTVFYTRKDAALRSFKIFKHIIGNSVDTDKEIFHEKDETYSTFIYKTKSHKYIIIGSYATLSQEYWYIDADKPESKFVLFQPREKKLEYSIDHFKDKWYIRTNKDEAKNFKIMTCPLENTTKENWVDFIGHRDDVLLEGIELFKDYYVVSERIKGLTKLKVTAWHGNSHYIDFGENVYTAGVSINPDFDSKLLRVDFTSMTTPNTTYDYDMQDKKLILLKQQEVVGHFDPKDYESERIFAKTKDGREVPISIVYKRGFVQNGTRPLLLYAYGSYGNSMDPYFSSVRLSLLDRGFAFAIAHIRGGEEMGRYWYEEGKFLNKKNTFTDYIECAEQLIAKSYTNKDKLFAMGGSAGGLLMGAVVNMKPELFKGVVAQVPFVDVLTTMLDESIPLTTGEYDEWGNPNDKVYYDYMKSYSPYDNVEAKAYPAMLVTTGYWDSQVQYWEPAKWVAKLREMKTDNNPLLLYCNMDTGHGGASGRFERYKETAREYAFILDLAGLIGN